MNEIWSLSEKIHVNLLCAIIVFSGYLISVEISKNSLRIFFDVLNERMKTYGKLVEKSGHCYQMRYRHRNYRGGRNFNDGNRMDRTNKLRRKSNTINKF
jgi:hypothetical protein